MTMNLHLCHESSLFESVYIPVLSSTMPLATIPRVVQFPWKEIIDCCFSSASTPPPEIKEKKLCEKMAFIN